jgi:hypothetical protein
MGYDTKRRDANESDQGRRNHPNISRLLIQKHVGKRPSHLHQIAIEQLSRPHNILGPLDEQAVLVDAVAAAGEHMDREAAMNLVWDERHQLGSLTGLGALGANKPVCCRGRECFVQKS